MKALLDGQVIAESDDVVMLEGNCYFPRESVAEGVLSPARLVTPCYWKGLARYYHVSTGESTARHAAWSYNHPPPWIRRIRGHVAFGHTVEVSR